MGMAAILVMWQALCWWIFIISYLQAYIQNLAENGPVATRESKFNFHM